jgi:hypothetical protein
MRKAAAILVLIVAAAGLSTADDQCIAQFGSAAVKQFLRDFQAAVATDDRSRVAQMVEFPISIQVSGKPKRLRNRSELLKYYDVAFDTKVKGLIAEQQFNELFCNWQGIMIGRGEIWVNKVSSSRQFRIIAINNNPPWSPKNK